ncbi:MAG: SRPBCC domain-containing protein [Gemmatimonadaceae bacterium]|nr:SRPBCC domain-containing protein [Gemmatimonadaceae bacterium]NUP55894.1 SRPBCC domain-containing protein [Gemmatimonadaceae bacterium]NUR34688.1 SRPBCC domain-containing protein [Gemmatimonadaceae bacterium]
MTAPMEFPDAHGSLRTIVEIAAPPDAVFTALSDERELAAWLGGDAASPAERQPSFYAPAVAIPGQPWRVGALAPDGSRGTIEGEFLLVDRPHRLESTWRASWDGFAPDRVCFELTPIPVPGGARTRLTVTHTRAGGRLRVTAMASRSSASEWPAILARLGAWVSPRTLFGVAR